eukprot:TRINITY_DN4237_c0_g1_i1.p1 TRINITY_DN4237_c0_g1~~TRINITY_DN4237_c0_g1_i1.p1  ORF type:complete len:307 (+),score=24.14 TRINITY_DN4237_c0_g1_i1:69-989(+)
MDLAKALQQKKRHLNNVDPPPQQPLGTVGGGQPSGDTSKLKSIDLQMLKFSVDKNEWVPQDLVPNVKATSTKLNIVSYNIWIFEEDREARINALVKHFEDTKADLIALVETTVPATKFLQNHKYIQDNYYMSLVTQQSQPTSYKTCLLSRYPFSKLVLWDIPWSHRKVTAGSITFEIGKKLHTIEAMAVHLDSDYAGHNKRADQLQWLYSKTRQEDTICIMGDYNFHIDNEDKFFEDAGYSDMWKVVHGSKPGNTFERHRLDRICLKNYSSYFKPKSMQILSSVVPGCKTALSDHSGLHCELKILH